MRHHKTAYDPVPDDGVWPEEDTFGTFFGEGIRPADAARRKSARPTPTFFWQDGPHNENDIEPAPPSAETRLRERLTARPRSPARPTVDPSAFEPPKWAQETYNENIPHKGRVIAIASVLTVACGVGLGVALLQLPINSKPAEHAVSQVSATANAGGTATAVPVPSTPAPAKAITQRVAAAGGQAAPVPVAAKPAGAGAVDANTVVVTKSGQSSFKPAVKPQPVLAGQLRTRGDERVLLGDIVAARAMYLKAAELGDMTAAFKLGQTYDPVVLRELGVVGPKADRKLALHWYNLARQAGLKPSVKLGQVQTGSGQ